jgi:hypothetical protein
MAEPVEEVAVVMVAEAEAGTFLRLCVKVAVHYAVPARVQLQVAVAVVTLVVASTCHLPGVTATLVAGGQAVAATPGGVKLNLKLLGAMNWYGK